MKITNEKLFEVLKFEIFDSVHRLFLHYFPNMGIFKEKEERGKDNRY